MMWCRYNIENSNKLLFIIGIFFSSILLFALITAENFCRRNILRHTIKVTMMEDSAHYIKGDIIDALVYSGSTSNPMFHYLLGGFKQAIYEDITNVLDTEVRGDHVNNLVSTEIKKGMNNLPDISVPYFRPRCATAGVDCTMIPLLN